MIKIIKLRDLQFSSITCIRYLCSCWKCDAPTKSKSLFCAQKSCNVLQPVSLAGTNIFELLKIDEDFDVDSSKLNDNFKDLQRLLHPDKFAIKSVEEKQISNEASSLINQAYEVIVGCYVLFRSV